MIVEGTCDDFYPNSIYYTWNIDASYILINVHRALNGEREGKNCRKKDLKARWRSISSTWR